MSRCRAIAVLWCGAPTRSRPGGLPFTHGGPRWLSLGRPRSRGYGALVAVDRLVVPVERASGDGRDARERWVCDLHFVRAGVSADPPTRGAFLRSRQPWTVLSSRNRDRFLGEGLTGGRRVWRLSRRRSGRMERVRAWTKAAAPRRCSDQPRWDGTLATDGKPSGPSRAGWPGPKTVCVASRRPRIESGPSVPSSCASGSASSRPCRGRIVRSPG